MLFRDFTSVFYALALILIFFARAKILRAWSSIFFCLPSSTFFTCCVRGVKQRQILKGPCGPLQSQYQKHLAWNFQPDIKLTSFKIETPTRFTEISIHMHDFVLPKTPPPRTVISSRGKAFNSYTFTGLCIFTTLIIFFY